MNALEFHALCWLAFLFGVEGLLSGLIALKRSDAKEKEDTAK